MIKLRTLGESVIEVGRESFTPDADALFAALLYLATERGKRVPRDQLAELIWPEFPIRRARHCLRQIVYRMRVLGLELDGARESVRLPDSLVAPTFSAAPSPLRLSEERAQGTLRLGTFLPGYRPRLSEAFGDWVDATRAEMEARVRRSLLELAQVHRLRGEWADVEALARECVRLDPLNEEANLAIAECAAMVGGKSDALAILDRYIHDLGPAGASLRLPATVLRRRIAERFPTRRYAVPSDRCFVGRAELLGNLSTALLRARNGEGSAALLTGTPGVGKTRLVQELTSVAVMQGVRTVRVGCDETDTQRPMSVWVDAVPMLRELPGALGIAPESLRFLRRLTEIDPVDAGLTEPIRDPRWVASRIRQSLVDLVDAIAAETTLLLIVEDVHWLDASSWATVTAILEGIQSKRLLLIVTSRGPHPTPATPARCLERLVVHHVPALEEESATALIRAIAEDHGGTISDDALRWCVEVGEGSPLFLRELAVHCLEGGAPQVMPPALQPLVYARLARTSETAQRVAEAIATLGQLSTLHRIERMLELPTHELGGALAELSRAGLLAEGALEPTLRHAIVRALVQDHTASPTQRLLHRRAAIALEADVVELGSPDIVFDLLRHAGAAGEEARARPFILRAAARLALLGAPRDGVAVLERALPHLAGSDLYAAALRQLCRLLGLDGQWNAAYTVASRLLAEHSDGRMADDMAVNALLRYEAAVRSGQDVRELSQGILEIASDHELLPDLRIQAARSGMTLSSAAALRHESNAFYEAVADLRRRDGVCSVHLDELEMIHHANIGNVRDASTIADRIGAAASTLPDEFAQLTLFVALVDVYRLADDRDRGLDVAHEGVRLARVHKSEHFEVVLQIRILTILLELGRHAEARLAYPALRALAARSDQEGIVGSATDIIGARLAMAAGDIDEARAIAGRCMRNLERGHQHIANKRIVLTLALEVALRADPTPADPALVNALREVHDATQSFGLHDRTVGVLCEALRRAGQVVEAERLLARYVQRERRAGLDWETNARILQVRPEDFCQTLVVPTCVSA